MKNHHLLEDLLEPMAAALDYIKQSLHSQEIKLDEVPKPLQDLLDNLLKTFASFRQGADIQETLQVYLNIAKFMQSKFCKNLRVCLGATYILCEESEPQLLNKTVITDEAKQLADVAKNLILTIKVHYEPINEELKECNRKTEIFFTSNDKPTVFRVEETIPWDNLPSDVREEYIRSGSKKQSFKLYPKER
ncbi:hypothetical protein F7734_02060 [Scytonema sp. UIC 10036]|uniref:hypothetical protein n=1 Tax=Scytonema sp. UIC 10036 TaxID=2304196 RepID=UPI0012DAD5CE|nr:hypothetical protein [Scytonema sp. UIC 10036]MUG91335.1 hypothetical protein [Scytonema sp. UIC 10036]